MPNIENLRKQAKQYLRWHREHYYPVAAAIRMGLPRFREFTDPQILDFTFKLADAQELVARQNGFAGWQELKADAHAVTDETNAARRPVLTSVAPQLPVADLRASVEFFAKLGFAADFTYGDPPFYGQVSRDNARFVLRLVHEPVLNHEGLLSAAITVATADEIKQLFLIYKAEGVPFSQTLKKEPWGARNFIVVDPDGNQILFAGPAD